MEEQQIRELVQAYFDRLNGEDWQGLASLFATDAVLRAPGSRTWEGRDEVSAYYRAALAPYPEHRDEPTRVLVAGDTATVEIHFEGRLANGQPLAFDAVDVFDFADGHVVELSSWYDSHAVRKQLAQAQAAS